MLRFLVILALLSNAFAASGFAPAPAAGWQSKVEPALLAAAQTAGDQAEMEFIIFLEDQADLSGAAGLKTRAEKGRYVYERLTQAAARSQPAVLSALEKLGVEARPYWVANMIWVRGGPQALQAAGQRVDVARIYANPQVQFQVPGREPENPAGGPTASGPASARSLAANSGSIEKGYSDAASYSAAAPQEVEWNIARVNAPAVWAAGYTGQGVVIGAQDTGYDWEHPALQDKYRGWDGSSADHNYSWHDAIHSGGGDCGPDSPEPCDDMDHGTHTLGTMVGDDGSGSQIGMAPGAKWIGCRNMDQGVGTPITYSECYQWFLAPTDLNGENPRPDLAPDMINNSWSCPPSEGCTEPDVLLSVVENVRAAGILTVHSAGNDGGLGCSTVNTPAAMYDASFTVGNVTSSDTIAGTSSRGPVLLDGSRRIKPDVTAPGTSVRSSVPGGGYSPKSGTSMAAPHVTGLAALLISANPLLAGQVDALEALIEQSAVPLTAGDTCTGPAGQVPNNTYGWGRIDANAALKGHVLVLKKTASASPVAPGEVLTYTLTVTHTAAVAPTTSVVLEDVLPDHTTFITATAPHSFDGETVRWAFPSLVPLESRSVQLAVQVSADAAEPIVNDSYQVSSSEVASPVIGEPVITPILLLLAPSRSEVVLPGHRETYTHTLTNLGVLTDTFDLSLSSDQGWASLASAPQVTLGPREPAEVMVSVTVPEEAEFGSVDIAQLTATSRADPSVSAVVTDTTTVSYPIHFPMTYSFGSENTLALPAAPATTR